MSKVLQSIFTTTSVRLDSIKLDIFHQSRNALSNASYISTKSKGKPSNPALHQISPAETETTNIAVEISLLVGRGLAAFGILYTITEYGVDMTRCEGPSMMPTINSTGEIIVIEKFTHRIWGLEGGNDGKKRAKAARDNQKEWEKKEHKQFLLKSKKNDVYVPTWHEPLLLQVKKMNHTQLSSWSNVGSKFSSGINIGDVVVIEHPHREGTVCKRVLGLPGDMVLRPKSGSAFSSKHRDVMNLFEDDNELDGKVRVDALSESSLEVIPDGHLWVEGDNSMNSADSRNYGAIPSALVVGKVWFRLWPIRGFAQMVRGGRPMPPKNAPFTGSTIIPAGCEGEERMIVLKQ